MTTAPDLLVAGMDLPPLDTPPDLVPDGTRCVVTGAPLTSGYPLLALHKDSQGEFLDTFRGAQDGYVAESVARLFLGGKTGGDWNMGAWMVIESEPLFAVHPLIARDAARKADRPCWSELVRHIWPRYAGHNLVCLLTTDTKKRLWPRARVGALGASTPVYLHDGDLCVSASLVIGWPALIACLDLVETVYTAGFSKRGIGTSLAQEWKAATRVGLTQTLTWERQLAPWRSRPEFMVARLIAQKAQETE